jgi:transposase
MKLLNIIYSNHTLILEFCSIHFRFFNIHIIQKTQLSIIHMPLKWHHINKCNNNCKKIDVLISILVHLNSFTPIMNVIYNGWKYTKGEMVSYTM